MERIIKDVVVEMNEYKEKPYIECECGEHLYPFWDPDDRKVLCEKCRRLYYWIAKDTYELLGYRCCSCNINIEPHLIVGRTRYKDKRHRYVCWKCLLKYLLKDLPNEIKRLEEWLEKNEELLQDILNNGGV